MLLNKHLDYLEIRKIKNIIPRNKNKENNLKLMIRHLLKHYFQSRNPYIKLPYNKHSRRKRWKNKIEANKAPMRQQNRN